jgi:DNA (cytosine-5)-methyltransferase 1
MYNLEYVKKESAKEKFKVVSLFAGGGGSSTGYRLAGGKILAINEFVPEAQRVYEINYPETHIFKQDIRALRGKYILKKLNLKVGELDILDGSPPCSSFSTAGKREKGWGEVKKYSDKSQRTDDLFYEFSRILKELQPKVFIAENVKGITMGAAADLLGSEQEELFGGHQDTIFHTLKSCGYQVRFEVLNSKHYGVPQGRQRTIFIGVRNDIKKQITYPKISHDIINLEKAFADLKPTQEELDECNIEKYAIYKEMLKLKPGEQSEKYFSLVKLDPKKVSYTLTQTAGNQGAASIAHWDNRKFTVKECIRIMSFPDDYYLGDTYKNKVERLGRAVPPLMMKAVAEHIYKTILK